MRHAYLALVVAAGSAAIVSQPRAAHAQGANEQAAQIRFGRGRELFVARNFEGALTEFRAAVALVPSPNTRLYLARCLHNLNRNAEALIEYQRAGAEAADRAAREPRYGATRDTARSEASQIEPQVGRLVIHVSNAPDGMTVNAGGTEVPSALYDVPSPYDPRAVEVVAQAPGYLPFRTQANVTAGGTAEVTIALQRDPNAARAEVTSSAPPAGPPPPRMITVREGGGLRFAGIGIAVVGAVAGGVLFGVFGSQASARYTELRRDCPTGCPEMETRIAEGERAQLIADISLGGGIALLVVGGVLAIVGGPHEVQRPAPNTASARGSRPVFSVWGAPNANGGGTAGLVATF
jgi:hypothetical protein